MTVGEGTGCAVAGSVVHHKSDRVVVSSEIDCMIKDLSYIARSPYRPTIRFDFQYAKIYLNKAKQRHKNYYSILR